MPMRLQLVMLPLVILGMSCAGCSDDTSPTGGTDAAAPVATDAGTSSPDAGQPVVPADNPLLGTWAFDAPMAGSGVDGVAFYHDGSVAVFGRVAQCVAAELGSWRVEGEQLFIQMGEQPDNHKTTSWTASLRDYPGGHGADGAVVKIRAATSRLRSAICANASRRRGALRGKATADIS